MKIHYCKDYNEMSALGASLVHSKVESTPDLLFCAASGNSPTGLYELMVEKNETAPGFFDSMQVVKLDEWVGLNNESTFTSEYDIQQKLLKKLGIEGDRYISFEVEAKDPVLECERIQDELDKSNGIDICILGIGINGHIALNEPAEVLQLNCHVANLHPVTLASGMIEKVGIALTQGMTMGVKNILDSKMVILFITGKGKKPALDLLLERKIRTDLPASFLWLHPNAHLIINEESI
ncbi:galactosamine-6-phosphate isomerase [Algoriphagus ratkowskyi]|uniref:Galactosamine-6-phosphate isomerase n=1 Tax=Algoriphagus ratkowskyi TaxID=57028 RepID=A0A2W7R3W9_9BACT|nr:6-phosphogluconolactonase [Algoriphagus ratkowskyi]PZX53906.1 galactosamine-6-phosphate isomerase [Algoriphagus ratkowskyi]TXD76691.1 galactosamine-6-phosphate isomerase [Algoriphagus ratkowskyi]